MPNDFSQLEQEALLEHLSLTAPDVPLDQPGAWEARGYFDQNGDPTPLGEDYLTLEESGLLDQRGQLTEKGKAFSLDRDSLLMQENLPSFIIADKAGLLDESDLSLGSAVEGVAGAVGSALKSAGRMGWNMTASMFSDKAAAELKLEQDAAIMGALKNGAYLGEGALRMLDKVALDEQADETAYYASKQDFQRAQGEIRDLKFGEFVGGLLGSADVLESMEQSRNERVAQVGGEQRAAEIEQSGENFGSLALDPANYAGFGAGFFMAKGSQAPSLFMRLANKVDDAARATAEASRTATAVQLAKNIATRSDEMAQMALTRSGQLASVGDTAGAAAAQEFGTRAATRSTRATELLGLRTAEAEAAALKAQELVKKAGGAERILGAIETARQLKAVPFNAVAEVLDRTGALLTKGDELLEATLENVGLTDTGKRLAARTAAFLGVTINPMFLGIPAMLAAGPALKQVGNLSRVVGKEMLQARGSLPFFRRVAQNAAAGPVTRAVGRMMDNFTLGGKVLKPVGFARNALTGAGAAFPVNLAFESLAAGGELDPNVINRAAAGSLIFSATGAAAGSLVHGNLAAKQRQAIGDEINFRSNLQPGEKPLYNALGAGSRKVVSTYAAANPAVTIKLQRGGVSSYDPTTLTATINVESGNPLRPLVTHEMLHHTLIKGQMEDGIRAMLVGTEGTGGLFKSADGKIDPHFQKAMDAYNARIQRDGRAALSPEEFAIEYFIESGVDHVLGLTESGKLSEYAGRSTVERIFRGLVEQTTSKTPFIKDLFFNLGGAVDHRGNVVQGNGLLADGIREIPGAKKMLTEMLKKQAGTTSPAKKANKQKDAGTAVVITKENRPLMEAMFADLKTDADGNPIFDKDGNPEYVDRATYVKREAIGATLREVAAQNIRDGKAMPEGALKPSENGEWTGTHLTPDQLKAMEESGVFNKKQMAVLRMLNNAAKRQGGESFAMIYQPAIATNKRGKKVYEGLPATFREVVPVGVKISKAGNLVIETMSVTQLMKNANERAASDRGQKLYNGDVKAILADVQSVMDLHRAGEKTDAFYQEKYGPAMWQEYKNFVNTVFGLMTKAQKDMNPLFMEDGIRDASNIFKSRRADRINQTTRLQGETRYFLGYEPIKGNHFPNGR